MAIEAVRKITPLVPAESLETLRNNTNSMPFSDILSGAMKNLYEAQEVAAQDSYELALGESADLHNVMINANIETLAIETAVQLTSRAVSAYKEIMQMQI